MIPFWIALQFLTTFPVQLKVMPTQRQNAQSLLFYPIVGLLIGMVLFAIASILHVIPVILLSSIILVLWIWLTGGLHLDGLADTADAWVGGFGDRERTLQIMKDPSCGPMGVLSLIILCLIKWSAIYVLLEQHFYLPLLVLPILGRLAPLFLFLTTPYVREKGLGSAIAEYLPKSLSIFVLILSLMVASLCSWQGLIVIVSSSIVILYLRHKFIQRLDGITGDTVGASMEIVEAVALLSFAILFGY